MTRVGALARAQALDAEHATLHLAGRCDTVALKVFKRVRTPPLLAGARCSNTGMPATLVRMQPAVRVLPAAVR